MKFWLDTGELALSLHTSERLFSDSTPRHGFGFEQEKVAMGKDQQKSSIARSCRILIVEDNDDSRETLRNLLQLLGHKVEVARDGEEGIRKALTWGPEAAIIDIGLPRRDGFEVARKVRCASGRSILLIAHTAYGHPDDRRRGLEAGFDAYLIKPFDLSELSDILERMR
jgi:CheY-like chemotaxis protein